MRPQKRVPDYQLVAAWSGFLMFIGAGAFALGMATHGEAIAQQHKPRPEPIYNCTTGVDRAISRHRCARSKSHQ
jgi:hypothetical protein